VHFSRKGKSDDTSELFSTDLFNISGRSFRSFTTDTREPGHNVQEFWFGFCIVEFDTRQDCIKLFSATESLVDNLGIFGPFEVVLGEFASCLNHGRPRFTLGIFIFRASNSVCKLNGSRSNFLFVPRCVSLFEGAIWHATLGLSLLSESLVDFVLAQLLDTSSLSDH